jgi:hypothetical protein
MLARDSPVIDDHKIRGGSWIIFPEVNEQNSKVDIVISFHSGFID